MTEPHVVYIQIERAELSRGITPDGRWHTRLNDMTLTRQDRDTIVLHAESGLWKRFDWIDQVTSPYRDVWFFPLRPEDV
jgi:hypothetical protein